MSAAAHRDHVRVFFALWPHGAVRDAWAAAARDAQIECGGRATAREKVHLTLFFVGEIERARVAQLKALASSIEASAFELEVNVTGYWRHNRIVWAGAPRCPPQLATLVSELQQSLAREGAHAEDRPYVPHVTLVRNARRAPKKTVIAAAPWRVCDFVLVESAPSRSGVSYDVLARWPLVGSV